MRKAEYFSPMRGGATKEECLLAGTCKPHAGGEPADHGHRYKWGDPHTKRMLRSDRIKDSFNQIRYGDPICLCIKISDDAMAQHCNG